LRVKLQFLTIPLSTKFSHKNESSDMLKLRVTVWGTYNNFNGLGPHS